MKTAPIPLGPDGSLFIELDEVSQKALCVADSVATGNPTGFERRIESKYKVPCRIVEIPKTVLVRCEFPLVFATKDLVEFLGNPTAYARRIRDELADLIRTMDRFSL